MKVKKVKVKTSYEGCDYITAGKVYDVVVSGTDEILIDDNGDKVNIVGPSYGCFCPHLNDEGRWELVK